MEKYKSLLHETVSTTKTDIWNDSCSIKELTYAIEHGAVGATNNPICHQLNCPDDSYLNVGYSFKILNNLQLLKNPNAGKLVYRFPTFTKWFLQEWFHVFFRS